MKIVFVLLSLMIGIVYGNSEFIVTGKKVTAECEKIATQKQYRYDAWAGPCIVDDGYNSKTFLLHYDIVQESLPPCKAPEEESIGEFIDGNITIPDGYILVEENITKREQEYYDGYGKKSSNSGDPRAAVQGVKPVAIGIRTNLKNNYGMCSGLTVWINFQADEYAGVIRREYFRRVYKKSCNQQDRDYPVLADNEEILFSWSDNNRTNECEAKNGMVEERVLSCKSSYRCVKVVDSSCKLESLEYVNSFVNPRDRSFGDSVEMDGVDFSLNYSSKLKRDFGFGRGWSLSSYVYFDKNSSLIYFGGRNIWRVDSSQIENSRYILNGAEYKFADSGEILEIVNINSGVTILRFEYQDGNLTKIVDNNGKETIFNRVDNRVEITAPYGQITVLNLDSNENLESVEYEDGSSYGFEYDSNRSLMVKKRGLRGQESIQKFDSLGRIEEEIDSRGFSWRFEDNSTIKKVIRPIDTILYKNYPLDGEILKSQKVLPTGEIVEKKLFLDSNKTEIKNCGVVTTLEYEKDSFANSNFVKKSTTTTPSGLQNIVEYSRDYTLKDGKVRKIDEETTQNGKTSRVTTNYELKRVRYYSTLGRKTTLKFDKNMRNILWIEAPNLHKIRYKYDGDGRVVKVIQKNRRVEYSYNDKGYLTTVKDKRGSITNYSYDSRGRVIRVDYPDGKSVGFAYDEDGNIIALTTPTPTTHTFDYDELNLPTNYSSAMQKILNYEYDQQRRVTKVIKPSGKEINFEYQNGRLSKVLANNQETIYNYSCQNLLSQIKRDSEEFNYIYDGTLLKSITQKGILNQTIKIEYNNDFLPKSLEYSNKNFAIDYDSDGRVVKVGDFTIEYRGKSIITKDANYSKKIRLNGYGEVEKSKDKIFSFTLKRDGLGEIVKKVEKLNKKEIKSRYKYDLRGRLVEVKRGKKVVESYSYDANGNRVLATIYGKTYQAEYNQDDQLIKYGKFSYSYDEDGYLASKSDGNSTTDYEYGIFGELKRVATPTKTVEYLHNANHQRVAKKVDGEIREKYLWLNLTTLLAIYDKDDNLVWRFEYADSRMPITMRDKNGTKYYLHYDQVGSLRAVSDENKNIVKEIVYDTFGNIISDSNTSLKVPFGFAGGLQDRDTKLVRFGFRDYDPFSGRWTAKDPILFKGGDTNLYGYVLGDPVSGIDPSGRIVWGLIFSGADLLYQLYENNGNWKCINWSEVGLSLLGGGLLNGLTKGAFIWRGSQWSSTWGARSSWMRRNNIMPRKRGQQWHHWAVPQRYYRGNSRLEHIFNQPWNLNPINARFNNWLGGGFWKTKLGTPSWVWEVLSGFILSIGGYNETNCECR